MSAPPAVARRTRQLRQSVMDTIISSPSNQFPSAKTGGIFNALLTMAREEKPDDSMLSKLEPLEEEGVSCGVDAATLVAMLDQILVVVEEGAEAPAVSSPPPLTHDLMTEKW